MMDDGGARGEKRLLLASRFMFGGTMPPVSHTRWVHFVLGVGSVCLTLWEANEGHCVSDALGDVRRIVTSTKATTVEMGCFCTIRNRR